MPSPEEQIVYISLLDEGVEVSRPARAIHVREHVYSILAQQVCETESWEFSPGTRVRCEVRQGPDGAFLLAV